MNESRIHTFITAAHLGSFTRAAAQLYISPTAVVKQINQLEEETGLKLFLRSHHGITLTEEGTSFLKDMEKLELDYHRAIWKASSLHPQKLVIHMGVSALAPGTSLITEFNSLRQIDPKLHFNMMDYRNDMNQAGRMLSHLGEGIDIVEAFYDDHLLQATGCRAYPLENMPICIGIPASHPLYRLDRITYADLEGYTLLIPSEGIFLPMDQTAEDLKKNVKDLHIELFGAYEVSIFNRCVNDNVLLLAVEDWKNVHPLVKMAPLEGNHTIPFGILYGENPSEAVSRMLSAVKQLKKKEKSNIINGKRETI